MNDDYTSTRKVLVMNGVYLKGRTSYIMYESTGKAVMAGSDNVWSGSN